MFPKAGIFSTFKTPGLFLQRKCYAKCLTVKEAYNLNDLPKEDVCIKGWVKSVRDIKNFLFLNVNDGSNCKNLQVVIPSSKYNKDATFGSAVEINGVLVKSPKKEQTIELKADNLKVVGTCDVMKYPIKTKQSHTLEYLRSIPHLKFRSSTHSSLLRINDAAHSSVHNYFHDNNFIHVTTPILTTNDCEGAGEVFQVEPANKPTQVKTSNSSPSFFDAPTFLTVSGQFHLEAAAGGVSNVYKFGPVCRADPSFSRHHLAEFQMVEAEMSFIESLDDIMKCVENLIKRVVEDVFKKCNDDIEYLLKEHAKPNHRENLEKIMSKKFNCITYTEAIDLLSKANTTFENNVKWGIDLSKEHERYLVNSFDSSPVFIRDYPTTFTPFYAKLNEDGKTAALVDLLLPEVGEVCGGSLREHRLDVLKEKLKEKGVNPEPLKWYLELQEYGPVPHGGFGVGYERLVQMILGFENIKDISPFPRTAGSCKM